MLSERKDIKSKPSAAVKAFRLKASKLLAEEKTCFEEIILTAVQVLETPNACMLITGGLFSRPNYFKKVPFLKDLEILASLANLQSALQSLSPDCPLYKAANTVYQHSDQLAKELILKPCNSDEIKSFKQILNRTVAVIKDKYAARQKLGDALSKAPIYKTSTWKKVAIAVGLLLGLVVGIGLAIHEKYSDKGAFTRYLAPKGMLAKSIGTMLSTPRARANCDSIPTDDPIAMKAHDTEIRRYYLEPRLAPR